jgi:hypothetical protein
MTNGRAFRLAFGAGLLSLAAFGDVDVAGSDVLSSDVLRSGVRPIPVTHYARRAYGGAVIDLGTTMLQPLANSFALGVNHASFKNRHLYLVVDIVNLSAVTYGALHLLVTSEHGARQRVAVGRISPGRSQRVQIRLTTRCDRRPANLRVSFVNAVADYQPMPRKTQRPGGFKPDDHPKYLQQITLRPC